MDEALRVREFWFGKPLTGPLDAQRAASLAEPLAQRARLWFDARSGSAEWDQPIREEFLGLLERAARGELAGWADSPRRRLSLIIVLDQFPRNIYRGTAQAYAFDAQALGLSLSGMQSAADGALNVVERIFFYMPLQHAESMEVQDESVFAYKRLLSDAPAPLRAMFEEALQSAEAHRDLVRRFGRFPHRNRVLGRANTPEEELYLAGNIERFGQ